MPITDLDSHDQTDVTSLNWGSDAPRGGKAVMTRILKENATVPLFFGQTLVQSLRDVGYRVPQAGEGGARTQVQEPNLGQWRYTRT